MPDSVATCQTSATSVRFVGSSQLLSKSPPFSSVHDRSNNHRNYVATVVVVELLGSASEREESHSGLL